MKTIQTCIHFPDGNEMFADLSYCPAQINQGERLIIDGHRETYIVKEVSNQFLRVEQSLKLIMRNVILEKE